jgi:hypothetical protein
VEFDLEDDAVVEVEVLLLAVFGLPVALRLAVFGKL